MSRPKGSGSCAGCGAQGNFARHDGSLCSACRASLPAPARDVFSREAYARDMAIHRLSFESNPHLAALADRLGTARDILNAFGIVGNSQVQMVRAVAAKAAADQHERHRAERLARDPWAGYSQWPL